MKKLIIYGGIIFTIGISLIGCYKDVILPNALVDPDGPPQSVSYKDQLIPLFNTKCALSGCHNGDSTSVGNFNEYAEIKMRVDNGQFKIKMFDSKSMPPISQPPLTSEEYNKLKCWFDAGAPNN